MKLSKIQCLNCDTISELYLLEGQSLYRCKNCRKLTKVVETSEEAPKSAPKKTTKKSRKKKND